MVKYFPLTKDHLMNHLFTKGADAKFGVCVQLYLVMQPEMDVMVPTIA